MAIDRMLVAVGPGDDRRVHELASTAVEVARPTDAVLTLVRVFSEDGFEERVANPDDADPHAIATECDVVRELTTKLDELAIEYDVKGAVGDESAQIVTLAEELETDRIVVGGRRRSPTGKAVFGSTAQAVMLNAPCPVTFVKEISLEDGDSGSLLPSVTDAVRSKNPNPE
jgi:nucleotide-binding universal stress UspA family protein